MQVRWLMAAGAAVAQVAFAAQYMTVEQAQRAAFPDATEFAPAASPDAAVAAALSAPQGWHPRVFAARAGERSLGWFIVDEVIGKSELITYALALDTKGAVISVEILDYRESHGGEVRMAPWRKQFVGKTAADPVALNADIKNISGATLSCRHLAEGVHRLLQFHQRELRGAS